MFVKILIVSTIFWIIHNIVPGIYFKYIYREYYKKGQVIFSFDDGPNPKYTRQLIKLLENNNTKAIFFLVGEKIEKYPDLVLEIDKEGHDIGLHCYRHSNPILWGPIKTIRDLKIAKQAFDNLGIQVKYYRPPHGWVNLTMLYLLKKYKLELKLWTKITGDWEEDKDWQEIYRQILEEETGGLICLHDSNHRIDSRSKAPESTIRALEEYFKKRENDGKENSRK